MTDRQTSTKKLTEKEVARMKKNRQSAADSRKRVKEYIKSLEEEVDRQKEALRLKDVTIRCLEGENRGLQTSVQCLVDLLNSKQWSGGASVQETTHQRREAAPLQGIKKERIISKEETDLLFASLFVE